MPIETTEDLREHLLLAVDVEMSTVPLYLFGLFSVIDPYSETARLIRSVVTEEMLHVALVSNLLLSIGSEPRFDLPAIIPTYPALLKHHRPQLVLSLAPASVDQIRDTYMAIERPEAHLAPPEADQYETLGQFYHAIEVAFNELSSNLGIFDDPQLDRQMTKSAFYAPVEYDAEDSGGLMAVDSLETACQALEIMIHQGEGVSLDRWTDESHQELTHYRKFELIVDGGIADGQIHPCLVNPKRSDLPERLHDPVDLFNGLYRHLLLTMDGIFSGSADQAALVDNLYYNMGRLLGPLGRFLAAHPIDDGMTAGPTFEMYEFNSPNHVEELADLANRAAATYPELEAVAADVTSLPIG